MRYLPTITLSACILADADVDTLGQDDTSGCRLDAELEDLLVAAVEGAFNEAAFVAAAGHHDAAGAFAISLWDQAAHAGTIFPIGCTEPVDNAEFCQEAPDTGWTVCVQTGCRHDLTPYSRAWYSAGDQVLALRVDSADGTVTYGADPVHTWEFGGDETSLEAVGRFAIDAAFVGDTAMADVSHTVDATTSFVEDHLVIDLTFVFPDLDPQASWSIETGMGAAGGIRGELLRDGEPVATVVERVEDEHHLAIGFDWSGWCLAGRTSDLHEAVENIRDLHGLDVH